MKSVDYKNKLIKCLEGKFPVDRDFYVKVERFNYRDDWSNRNGVSFVCPSNGIIKLGISHYYDVKNKEALIFSWESNHPSIDMACNELLRMQTQSKELN